MSPMHPPGSQGALGGQRPAQTPVTATGSGASPTIDRSQPPAHGQGHQGGQAPQRDGYVTFSFSADNTAVEAMTAVRDGQTHSLDVAKVTFAMTVGTNDLGTSAVIAVAATAAHGPFASTREFSDTDGDGHYTPSFGIEVLTATDAPLRQHRFTLTDGAVTADEVLRRDGTWAADRIETGENYQSITLDGVAYVVKTLGQGDFFQFGIFRDDNGDGIWTQVAHGGSTGSHITGGALDLVGVQNYLEASNVISG